MTALLTGDQARHGLRVIVSSTVVNRLCKTSIRISRKSFFPQAVCAEGAPDPEPNPTSQPAPPRAAELPQDPPAVPFTHTRGHSSSDNLQFNQPNIQVLLVVFKLDQVFFLLFVFCFFFSIWI